MLSHMQAKGLSAGYNGEAVFRGLDLKIPEGSITTLIGSNGSGKSTILKTLCRIISPDSGAVYLDGEAIHRMPTKRVAQRLALLPQGAQAPAGITVGDLVEYGRFPYRSALSGLSEKDREIIQWALASTGMSSLEHREMERLSGGQQQRAWIAMALAQKTGLLFLDEPTTYLDISHQLDILDSGDYPSYHVSTKCLPGQLRRERGCYEHEALHQCYSALKQLRHTAD